MNQIDYLDQIRYSIRCKDKNWIKLGLIDLSGGGGLSPTPALSFPLSSLIIEKLGLSLYCLKIFKLVLFNPFIIEAKAEIRKIFS